MYAPVGHSVIYLWPKSLIYATRRLRSKSITPPTPTSATIASAGSHTLGDLVLACTRVTALGPVSVLT